MLLMRILHRHLKHCARSSLEVKNKQGRHVLHAAENRGRYCSDSIARQVDVRDIAQREKNIDGQRLNIVVEQNPAI